AAQARNEFALKSDAKAPQDSAIPLCILAFVVSFVCLIVLDVKDGGFESDIVYTHILSRLGQSVALLVGCFIALLGIASKLWDIGNSLRAIETHRDREAGD